MKRGALREEKMWEVFVSTLSAFTSEMSHKLFWCELSADW